MKKLTALLSAFIIMTFPISVLAVSNPQSPLMPIFAKLDIINGDENGNLRLGDAVSRAEFVKMAVSASKFRKTVATNIQVSSYADVSANHWAAPYIKVAADNNLVRGYIDATFRPEHKVTFEEAVTVILKILGYTDDDFGISWPHGQIGIAKQIGVLQGTNFVIGQSMTRENIATLMGNMLICENKEEMKYAHTLGYKVIDGVEIVSIGDNGKVVTEEGSFRSEYKIDASFLGRKGALILNGQNELLGFVPDAAHPLDEQEKYILYAALEDTVVVYQNGIRKPLYIKDTTTTYKDEKQTTFGAVKSQLSLGDVLHIQYDATHEISYVSILEGVLDGPKTVSVQNIGTLFDADLSSATVLRDGTVCTLADIQAHDIIYYASNLNIVFAYHDTKTGVYQKATPNTDTPQSITLSGTEYAIESAIAFQKLSSSGNYKLGDAITVLLGKDGKIADVYAQNEPKAEALVGYVADAGAKPFTENGQTTKQYYTKIVTPDGGTVDYKTRTPYTAYKNSVVKVTFDNEYAKLQSVSANKNLSGVFDFAQKSFAGKGIASGIQILDVYSINREDSSLYKAVFPQRIDGVKLSEGSVLYYEEDEKGSINKLILKNVTGDTAQYGMMEKAENVFSQNAMSGTYRYDIDGTVYETRTSGKLYAGVYSGTPVKLVLDADGVQAMQSLTAAQGNLSELNESFVKIGNESYPLASDVKVYVRDDYGKYPMLEFSALLQNPNAYNITAYYDKLPDSGGRVRVLVAKAK